MFCTVCGKENSAGARFCSQCGAAFASAPVYSNMGSRTLLRSRRDRVIAGVCAGMACAYGWDVTVVRIVTVLGGIFLIPFVGIGYIAAWVFMPEEPLELANPVPKL